jgi:hypothetical protein
MERTKSKHLVLILARDLAANVATPMLIADASRVLVYFNEPAEVVLGESFARTGEVPLLELYARWHITKANGDPYPPDEFPMGIALREQRPAHGLVQFLAGDGVRRTVAVNAYPLLTNADEFVGAVSIFWET